MGHLVDAQLVFSFCVRQMLTLDLPALPSCDQDGWTALSRTWGQPLAFVLTLLALLRERNLRSYASLSPEQ